MTDTFFTGKPCRNGHIAPRYVNGRRCVQCKSEKDARYYAGNGGEQIREKARVQYYGDHEAQKAYRREYHARRRDDPAYQAVREAYNEKHHERLLDLKRARNATPEAKAAKAAKKREDAAKYRGYQNTREARKKNAVPKWFGELDQLALDEAADLIDKRRTATGIDWQIDHMLPMLARTVCGLHVGNNLQVIPRTLNAQKNNKLILTESGEWIRQL